MLARLVIVSRQIVCPLAMSQSDRVLAERYTRGRMLHISERRDQQRHNAHVRSGAGRYWLGDFQRAHATAESMLQVLTTTRYTAHIYEYLAGVDDVTKNDTQNGLNGTSFRVCDSASHLAANN